MTEDHEGDDPQGSDSTGDPQLDRQVADLEQSGDKVAARIEETRSDWESKKDDPSVPGALAEPKSDDEEESDDEEDADGGDDGEDRDEADDSRAGKPYEWVDPDGAAEDDSSDEDSGESDA